jgi:hypothetical protein
MIIILKPDIKKRRRKSILSKELKSDREINFRDDEQRALKLRTKDDSSYRASSISKADSN